MDSAQREEFQRQLLAMRRDIAGDAATHTREGFSLGHDGNQDVGDAAANSSARQVLLGLGDRERELLQKIDEALDRIDDGGFGSCDECGEEIGLARLRALPHTELCVECKALQEDLSRR
jgi:DnaK suppressor protein